ncbi:MAG: HU family DNA-binding protein [Muribaculaceae bacterium]|nr:HU family DNA-binding protein [Muribaculaceae bacterium]
MREFRRKEILTRYKFFNKMTKADIVNEISRSTGLEKAAVLATVEKFMEVVKDSMAEGNNVYLRGFGSFVVKTRKEKTARNISKNTAIRIPEHKVPAFKPSRVFLDQVK